MKQTTKEWFIAAEDDLLAAKKLADEERLTNVVAFHCQQCLEKCFKAIIEEQGKPSMKSHDLLRLQLNNFLSPKRSFLQLSMKYILMLVTQEIWGFCLRENQQKRK